MLPANLKSVQWGATIALNTMRAFSAGLVWAVVTLFSGGPGWWLLPFLLAAGYVLMLPGYFLACKIAAVFIGDYAQIGIGLLTLIIALGIAVGDPGVYFLRKSKPHWVPVETFKPINVAMVLYVMHPGS